MITKDTVKMSLKQLMLLIVPKKFIVKLVTKNLYCKNKFHFEYFREANHAIKKVSFSRSKIHPEYARGMKMLSEEYNLMKEVSPPSLRM